jgi:hypothetical protein
VILAALVAAAIAFAYGSKGSSGSVQITPVDGDSVTKIVDQMEQLVDDNTR